MATKPVGRRGGNRPGHSLVELLVVAAVVGLLGLHTLDGLRRTVSSPTAASGEICRANKRNLTAALQAWQAMREDGRALELPGGYPELVRAGLLQRLPFEPGTRAWEYTYGSSPGGEVWCRVHDRGEAHPGAEAPPPSPRLLALELLAFALIVAAATVWFLLHRRHPLLAPITPFTPGIGVDSETAREVREWLAATRGR